MNDTHDIGNEQQTQDDGGDMSSITGQGEYAFATSSDKKQPNRMMLLLAAALLLGGGVVYFMYFRTGPSAASAATKSESAAASKAISQFLDDGGKNLKLMEEMLHNTEKVVQQFRSYPNVTQVPLKELRTNPFRFAAEDSGSKISDAAAARKREEERLAVLKASKALTLQTIMHGESRRACMINNMLVQEGQQVDNFTVERINPASVTVRQGEYRFDLTMQR